jgi:hypothetical protein
VELRGFEPLTSGVTDRTDGNAKDFEGNFSVVDAETAEAGLKRRRFHVRRQSLFEPATKRNRRSPQNPRGRRCSL